ncbi:DNA-directed RNA polymerase subunit alpha [Neochlamydia sp. EPS4]|uniref:DNA-directed RNA polymerase subunit alpha n=1 Tax=unclassified Neochlamydia TaxID=2643326 RepID=UPI00057FF30E|nr:MULTISPECIES: DNA-directed RNA polymerase subunit alpha [unclassified Neochlamydia]KIC72754.1 DNA-directed RNA polymerase subunit alpha [Neochlamydia sp. EPS4]KIC76803.1 DNA-directed RNA polymerase subunit alpha [Neochlamydia sp. TUME1]BBI17284.1 DNA-directed RNA polymerase subunit alpha [Neochlamydia sp. S13]
MSVKYGKFEMPQKILVEEDKDNSNVARIIAEPFERGFGHTIGNSMRRMMLSSLEAPAIIALRIEGVPHEYMAIEGVIEDMTNIVLNLKGALLRKLPTDESSYSRDTRILTCVLDITQEELDKNNGQYKVTLGDIVKDGSYEVVNSGLHLFTVTKPMKRQLDLRVAIGRGYVPSERHIIYDKTADEILLDASFSPVRIVNYFVENTRVGQDTDFDRLIFEVVTDGRVTPVEAVSFASQIGVKHFDVFTKAKSHSLVFDEGLGDGDSDADEMMEKLCLRIDEIELSVRSTNCLSGANIDTIAELVSIPERKMLEFRNFGKKSLNEIKAKLHEMNLSLGMDLSRYGITHDNVKDKIKHYNEDKKGRKELAKVED